MILLTSTSDQLLLVTGGSQVVHVKADWMDLATGGVITPGHLANATGVVSSATTTTIVPSPASGVERNLKFLSVTNTDPTTAVSITLQHTDGTTPVQIGPKINLPPGYLRALVFNLAVEMADDFPRAVLKPMTVQIAAESKAWIKRKNIRPMDIGCDPGCVSTPGNWTSRWNNYTGDWNGPRY